MAEANVFQYDVFISHSSLDKQIVRALAERLRADGVRVWFDEWEIKFGESIPYRIMQGLDSSRVVLLVLSRNFLGSDWSLAEPLGRLFSDPLNRLRRLLPLVLDEMAMPGFLSQLKYIDWRNRDDDAYKTVLNELRQPSQQFEPRLLKGHRAAVTSIAVTADGKRAISGSEDTTVRVWDLVSDSWRSLEGHADSVLSVAVSDDGVYAISGSKDSTVRLWDLSRNHSQLLAGHKSAVLSVAITPNGHRAVSGSEDGTVFVWDLTTSDRRRIAWLEGGESHRDLRCVAVTPDGNLVVSGGADDTIRVLDLTTRAIGIYEHQGSLITGIAVTRDGRHALVSCFDNVVRVRALDSGTLVAELSGHRENVLGVAVTPDGRRAASSSSDRTVRVWDLWSGEGIGVLEGHDGSVTGVALTPDGRRVVSCAQDMTIRVWDLPSAPARIDRFAKGVDVGFPRNRLKNVYFALATYEPGARLEYHTHPTSEVMFAIRGTLSVRVAGRQYRLRERDSIYFPAHDPNVSTENPSGNTAHLSWNETDGRVMFLWVLGGMKLSRTFVTDEFVKKLCGYQDRDQFAGSEDYPEYVERFERAHVTGSAPGCELRELFSLRSVGPDICLTHGTLDPSSSTGSMRYDSEVCVLVLHGRISCGVGESLNELAALESVVVPSGAEHLVSNRSDEVSEFLVLRAGPK